MDDLDLAKLRRNLRAVAILGYLVAGISCLGGGAILAFVALRFAPQDWDEPAVASLVCLGQITLFPGIFWLALWSYSQYQLRRLLRRCEDAQTRTPGNASHGS